MVVKTIIKRSFPVVAVVGLLVNTAIPAFAQTISPKAGNLSSIQAKGDQYISQRLTSLNTLLTKINAAKHLKPDDKNEFVNNITTDINGLTALKSKIDADTDIVTARADVKSIFITYRVYVVFDPQTQLLAASDTMTVLSDELDDFGNKLEGRINEAGTNGHDVTALRNLLADMRAKINDARGQYASVESSVSPLTPNSYNTDPTGTKTTFENARTDIKTGRTDLQGAWSDAKQIRQGLRAFGSSASTSPTVTP